MTDSRLAQYRNAALAMARGNPCPHIPFEPLDEVGLLGHALSQLGRSLDQRREEARTLARVTERINVGLRLDDVMDRIYTSFRTLVPFDRLGLALLEKDGKRLISRWTRTEAPRIHLGNGYSRSLEGSSLQAVMASRQPRIINDLPEYLKAHPRSEATALIVAEGMQSSLTCPLVVRDRIIGMLFFSSLSVDTYRELHQEIFVQIAGHLALVVEKGSRYEELHELNAVKDRFLGVAAQDLGLPLAEATLQVERLLADPWGTLRAEQRELLKSLVDNHRLLQAQVDEMLDLSAIQSGRLELNRVPTDLRALLQPLEEPFKQAALAQGTSLRVVHGPAIPPVLLDPQRMRQVLGKLLANAVRLSDPAVPIVLSTGLDGEVVEIRLTRQPQESDEDDLPGMFTHAGQTLVPGEPQPRLTGMGLALARSIMAAHGGSLRMEKHAQAGSTFTLSLPLSS